MMRLQRSGVLIPVLMALLMVGCASCSGEDAGEEEGEDFELPTQEVEESEEADEEEEVDERADRQAEPDHPTLLIGIDGVRHDYFELYEEETETLRGLIDEGVKAESLKPIFPTATFPNLYATATGLYAENHGIVANTVYDPQRGVQLRMSDSDEQQRPEWWKGEPIWATAEMQGLKAGTFFWVGSEAPYNGERASEWVAYDGRIPHRHRVEQVVHWLSDEDPVDFATLYFSAVDSAGHSYGPESEEVAEALADVDRNLQRLIDQLDEAGVWPDINLVIISDHGMIELDEDKTVFLDEIIDMDDVFVNTWGPVAMINYTAGDGDVSEVYDALANADEAQHYEVYLRDDIPERYRLKGSERAPDLLVVADMPYSLTNTGYFQDRGVMTATHGYDPEYMEMHGIFAAHGPDIAQGKVIDMVEIVDIYALMAHLLDLEPAEHDGSFERIAPALREQ